MKYSREIIEKQYLNGQAMKFVFFWGHQKHASGKLTKSCFSQWWFQDFKIDGVNYPTAEHWMMAEKARLFKDEEILHGILKSKSPGHAKQLGREVRNFNQEIWEDKRFEIVIKGNYYKFTQNPELKMFLVDTQERILAEASPVDKIWGIGLDSSSEFANVPIRWNGLNLLGFALMEVRDMIKGEAEAKTKN